MDGLPPPESRGFIGGPWGNPDTKRKEGDSKCGRACPRRSFRKPTGEARRGYTRRKYPLPDKRPSTREEERICGQAGSRCHNSFPLDQRCPATDEKEGTRDRQVFRFTARDRP